MYKMQQDLCVIMKYKKDFTGFKKFSGGGGWVVRKVIIVSVHVRYFSFFSFFSLCQ